MDNEDPNTGQHFLHARKFRPCRGKAGVVTGDVAWGLLQHAKANGLRLRFCVCQGV